MSTTDTTSQAETAVNIIRDTQTALVVGTADYGQAVKDSLGDYSLAIGDVLSVGDQAASDLEELRAKQDLVPAHGFDRLHREVVADAESRSAEALRRAEAAEGRLLEALTEDALPTFEPNREPLARQEVALALDGADGKTILSRVVNIAQHGSPEAVACLIRTPFGRTLLASRGASGREIDEALSHARKVAAVRAAENGQTERQRQAGKALGQIGRLGAARTAARMHLNRIIG